MVLYGMIWFCMETMILYGFVWMAKIWYGKVWIIGLLDFYMDFYG